MGKETRMNFVEKWAHYVCEHADADWSQLQKELIDSQLQNAENIKLTREQVDRMRAAHSD